MDTADRDEEAIVAPITMENHSLFIQQDHSVFKLFFDPCFCSNSPQSQDVGNDK